MRLFYSTLLVILKVSDSAQWLDTAISDQISANQENPMSNGWKLMAGFCGVRTLFA